MRTTAGRRVFDHSIFGGSLFHLSAVSGETTAMSVIKRIHANRFLRINKPRARGSSILITPIYKDCLQFIKCGKRFQIQTTAAKRPFECVTEFP